MPINLIAKKGLWVISMSNIGKISVTFLSALWWFPWSPVNLNPPRGHLNCLCWSLKDFFFKTHVKNIWISKFFSIGFIPCLFTVMILSQTLPLVIKLGLITRLITIKNRQNLFILSLNKKPKFRIGDLVDIYFIIRRNGDNTRWFLAIVNN